MNINYGNFILYKIFLGEIGVIGERIQEANNRLKLFFLKQKETFYQR